MLITTSKLAWNKVTHALLGFLNPRIILECLSSEQGETSGKKPVLQKTELEGGESTG